MARTLPGRPLRWVPRSLTDSIDGTNSAPGAMQQLANLVACPSMRGAWVPRSASLPLATFAGAAGPGVPNGLLQVGTLVYGMIPETIGTYMGLDVPFCFNRLTSSFETIGGLTVAGLPTSPSPSGDWTPPSMAQVGPRIIITHPGFAGGVDPFFGWLDVSGFTSSSVTGSTNTSKTITGLSTDVLQAGWAVGMTITDAAADLPAGTVITGIAVASLDLNTTATMDGTNTLNTVASLTGVVVGSTITGYGIPLGTLVQSLPGSSKVVMTQAATISGTLQGINFSGATTVSVSQAATGSNSTTFTVSGGTLAAPLYGSGNTNTNPLPTVPTCVANFNGRAYFGCPKNGLKFSDSLNPCQITYASQGLNPANGLDFTALAGLPETQVIGGIIQALIGFQGPTQMQQITGDPATGNLALNELGTGIGTTAPNTVCQTTMGLAFISSAGLRFVSPTGSVTDPVGANGMGVAVPFQNAVAPTRMCAAFADGVLRISVQNGAKPGQPFEEYWLDFSSKAWSGPHSFPAALIVAGQGGTGGFAIAPIGVSGKLFSGSAIPLASDSYIENGVALSWRYETALLPEASDFTMHKIVDTAITGSLPGNESWTVQPLTETGAVLDTVTLAGPNQGAPLWGTAIWGQFLWGGGGASVLQQQPVFWHLPIIFKQASFLIAGSSALGTIIGNLNLRVQDLGYFIQAAAQTGPVGPQPSLLVDGGGNVLTDTGGNAFGA